MSSSVGSSTGSSSSNNSNRSSSTSSSGSTSTANRSDSTGSTTGSQTSTTNTGGASTSRTSDATSASSVSGAKDATSPADNATATTSTADSSQISSEAKETDAASASVSAISQGLAEADKPAAESPSSNLGAALGEKSLRGGMNSESVGALQGALNEKLGLSLDTDGKFGPKTTEAVRSFQKQQGLKPDGVVGPKTREALIGSTAAKPADAAAKPADAAAAPTDAATTPTDAATADATAANPASPEAEAKPARTLGEFEALDQALGSKEIGPGSKDTKAVGALQGALNEALGGSLDVDGKFGNKTRDAIKEFQEKSGLDPSGTVDDKTRQALLGDKPAATREDLQDREAARQQAATESAPDMIFGDRISASDQARVREVAQELQTSPNDLMAVFGVETGGTFDPAQRANGTTNGAVGLVQFTGTAITAMNQRRERQGLEPISKADLASMSFSDQLDHARDYLRDTMAERGVTGPVTRDELYTAVVAPAFVNRPDSANVYSAGTRNYRSNRSLDTDRNGHITREEITNRVDQWYNDGMAELNS